MSDTDNPDATGEVSDGARSSTLSVVPVEVEEVTSTLLEDSARPGYPPVLARPLRNRIPRLT